MARPQLHPRSGVYWLRKRVPADLVAVVGRREEFFSLQTRDPAEAKVRHTSELLKLELRWASLRTGPRTLNEREAHALSADVHDSWLAEFRDFPSRQTFWRTDIGSELWGPTADRNVSLLDRAALLLQDGDELAVARARRVEWCSERADDLMQQRGLVVDDAGKQVLRKAVAAAVQRASLTLERLARGEAIDLPQVAPVSAAGSGRVAPVTMRPPANFDSLVEGWAAETSPAPRTRYEWARVFKRLAAFLGHDDAQRLTANDLISWKEKLVADGLSAKTIRDANLAAIRGILRWAVNNRRLAENAAERISIDLKRKPGRGIRGFTDSEAETILRAAAEEADPVRRWVPWICAFSGARISEVCQLRVVDVVQLDQIWAFRFDAEAGSLKNVNSERTIPVHSALIAAGFLAFVQAAGSGPLFPTLPPDKFGARGGTGTRRLGPWVRGLGLTDERLSPSHSWRHRFKTLARRHELKTDIADSITGHGRASVGDSYGEYELPAMQREIEKIPGLPSRPNDQATLTT